MVESAAALKKEQRRSGTTLSWTPSELALIESWIRLRDAAAEELDASAGRQARSQKEKTLFFATRDLQDALTKVDLSIMQARVDAGLEPSSDVLAREIIEEEEVSPTQPEVAEGLDRAERAGVERRGVDEDAVSASGLALEEEVSNVYGVTLPAAEVVGEGRRSDSGIRLRPIQREEMERAIIGTWAEQPEGERVSAAETYDEPAGRPREVGVEYKVQIGAFRNPLPAALFAAFDPRGRSVRPVECGTWPAALTPMTQPWWRGMPFVRWVTATRSWCGLSMVSASVGPVLRRKHWLRSGRIGSGWPSAGDVVHV